MRSYTSENSDGLNRLAVSEKVPKKTAKSDNYFNYMSNRKAGRITSGKIDRSLTKRLLDDYSHD